MSLIRAVRERERVVVRCLDTGSGIRDPRYLFQPFQPGALPGAEQLPIGLQGQGVQLLSTPRHVSAPRRATAGGTTRKPPAAKSAAV